jgi:hypothetical protein
VNQCGASGLSSLTFKVKGNKKGLGIGVISAMEVLLELQDVSRFRRAEKLPVQGMETHIWECWSACNHVGKSVSPN